MVATGLQLNGFAGLDFQPLCQFAHLHHTAVHAHFMDLDAAGDFSAAADEPVGGLAGVGDREEASSHLGARRGDARPGLGDDEVADLDFCGDCGARHGENYRSGGGEHEAQGFLEHLWSSG